MSVCPYIYIYIDLFVLSSFKCILSLLMNSFSYCTFLHDLIFAYVHVYVKWSLNFDLNFKIFLWICTDETFVLVCNSFYSVYRGDYILICIYCKFLNIREELILILYCEKHISQILKSSLNFSDRWRLPGIWNYDKNLT